MEQNEQARPAFEAAAEEELERIHLALEESRQRRRQASDAFDSFLRSFREKPTPPPAPPIRSLPREPRVNLTQRVGSAPPAGIPAIADAPAPAQDPARQPAAASIAAPISGPARSVLPPEVDPPKAVEQVSMDADVVGVQRGAPRVPAAVRGERTRQQRGRLRNVAAFALLAVGGVVFIWRIRSPEVSQLPPAAGHPPVHAAAPAPAAAAPQPDPAAAHRLNALLITVRPVWVRVLVDGERAIERELPAGQKIPLSARQTVAVRAGDAGAVRMTIDGKDQGPLGQDGAVATRTFTKPR